MDIEVIAVTTTPKSWRETKLLTKNSPKIHPALGLHPQLIPTRVQDFPLFEALISEARFIGEVGLDGSKEFKKYLPEQKDVLNKVLHLCEIYNGKIISLHSRGAVSDLLNILDQYPYCGNIILHWFTGSIQEAQRAVDLGCFFSINYAMFRSKKGTSLIKSLPKERILTETDGPFIDYLNRAYEPTQMSIIIDLLSSVWGISPQGTKLIVNKNFSMVLDV